MEIFLAPQCTRSLSRSNLACCHVALLPHLIIQLLVEFRQLSLTLFLLCVSQFNPWNRLSSFSSQVTVPLRVVFFVFSLSYFFFHCSAVSSTFRHTVFLMVLALVSCTYRCPNISVDFVSASL
uniref:Uncharacterized protein n=1 Tax=Oncorhynchus kisutch TaxID=8019 RepID=A0A8C7KIV2_ONCKI